MGSFFDPEILVLGGGGLGTVTAMKAAQFSSGVALVRRSDALSPQGDTFRNHGWLQSGLIYSAPRNMDLFESKLMYQWGIRLHRELYLEPPDQPGMFRTGQDEKAAQLVATAKKLGVPIDDASDNEGKHFLRDMYKTGQHHHWVPDTSFHEAEVIMTAREMAKEYGAELIDLPADEEPPSLELDEKEPNGYRVRISGRIVKPRITIVCTGQALPSMLARVNYFPPLAVFRSVLLRAENVDWIGVPLFYDLDTGFAIVNHTSTTDPSKTWTVFGDSKRERLTSTVRTVTEAEFKSAISFLPHQLRGPDPFNTFKATAGHKTEILDADGKPSARHWIEEVPNCSGLYAAIPGKVTIVLWVALEILKKAGLIEANLEGGYIPRLPPAGSNSTPSPAIGPDLPSWEAQVEMHWERPDLNDLTLQEDKDSSQDEALGGGGKD